MATLDLSRMQTLIIPGMGLDGTVSVPVKHVSDLNGEDRDLFSSCYSSTEAFSFKKLTAHFPLDSQDGKRRITIIFGQSLTPSSRSQNFGLKVCYKIFEFEKTHPFHTEQTNSVSQIALLPGNGKIELTPRGHSDRRPWVLTTEEIREFFV